MHSIIHEQKRSQILPVTHKSKNSSGGGGSSSSRNISIRTMVNDSYITSTCNSVRIAHCAMGNPKSPPVLLIMGYGGKMQEWWPFDQKLVDHGFYVIKFDNRDVGHSQRFGDETPMAPDAKPLYALHDMADDALAVLDYYGSEKAHILGVSMGGMIAQVIGTKNPARCITLVLIMNHCVRSFDPFLPSTEMDNVNGGFFEKLSKLTKPERGMTLEAYVDMKLAFIENLTVTPAHPEFNEKLRKRTKEVATEEYKADAVDWEGACLSRQDLAFQSWNADIDAHRERLGSLNVPALVLHGKYDRLIPVEFGRELAERLPNSHFVEYDGSHSFGNHFDGIDFIVAKVVAHLREYSKTIAETA